MRILTTDPLFAWDKLPDSPSLQAIAKVLDLLPDQALLASLRRHRGHGRNDYPVHVLWRVHLVRPMLRHITMEACLGELERNPALRRLVGLEPGMKLPQPCTMSRFQQVLGLPHHLELMKQMFEQMARALAMSVEDLGRHLAGDSSALSARADDPDRAPQDLPQPNGARKEYHDESGKVVRTYEWFGYKFHLLVDTRHEVAVAFQITPATGDDAQQVPDLVDQAQRVLPPGRIQTLAYDKAADCQKVHQLLAGHSIKPVIETRSLWKNQTEQMLPGHDGNSNVVHDEAGTLYCYHQAQGVLRKRKMSYIGYEKSRGTLKFRCPARHENIPCPSDRKCNGPSRYGKTVRVKCQVDLRRFPPIPRATAEFERRYKGRTAVERVNARCKLFWGADDGNVTGAARFHAHLHSIMLVHIGFATLLAMSPRQEGKSLSPTRLSVIARRLHAATKAT